jgi:hypothetical protein
LASFGMSLKHNAGVARILGQEVPVVVLGAIERLTGSIVVTIGVLNACAELTSAI